MKTYTFRIVSSYYVETTVTLDENEDVDEDFDQWLEVVDKSNLYCHTFLDRTFEIHEPITMTLVNDETFPLETEIP